MKLKLRFLAGGTIFFLLGLILGQVKGGYGLGYEALMGVGLVLLVAGLFWKDKPRAQSQDGGSSPHQPRAIAVPTSAYILRRLSCEA